MIPSQGDIIEVSFNPTLGHEPKKTRPALVVSTDKFNLASSLTVVLPITSIDNKYPLHIKITSDVEIDGYVCVEQLRLLNLSCRRYKTIGALSKDDMAEVLERIGAVFGI